MEHIEETHEPAFHLMMADIYRKARCVSNFLLFILSLLISLVSISQPSNLPGVVIANINFNELEG
jgi:hypothetical protein